VRVGVRDSESPAGQCLPLGVTYDGNGTNFAIFSQVAAAIKLCLFDMDDRNADPAGGQGCFVWHCYLPRVLPGQRYGYRNRGPVDPAQGLRCNANKLLLTPIPRRSAELFVGTLTCVPTTPGSRIVQRRGLGVVHGQRSGDQPAFLTGKVTGRQISPPHRTLIHEAHVKGLTRLHPDIPVVERGMYADLYPDAGWVR
jgi:isoamylase